MIFRPAKFLPARLLAVSVGVAVATAGADPELSVRFGEETVTLAGRVDSDETARKLAAAALEARPDLRVVREGLVIDAAAGQSHISDLRSLISELGLTTHEGRLEIWADRILVGGLTDSSVTLAALRIRLDPLREERRFINHICIVDTEYLPKVDVSLTDRASGVEVPPLGRPAARERAFEAPGLLVEKLVPTLLMLKDFDRIEGRSAPPLGEVLRATPLAMAAAALTTDGADSPPAIPRPQYETLPSVRFSRSSFLLQANQEPIFEELTRALLSPDRQGRTVLIEAVRASGGSSAFNDYLCERRSAEVIRFLTERGVNREVLKSVTIDSPSTIDEGEVRVRVEIHGYPATMEADSPAIAPNEEAQSIPERPKPVTGG